MSIVSVHHHGTGSIIDVFHGLNVLRLAWHLMLIPCKTMTLQYHGLQDHDTMLHQNIFARHGLMAWKVAASLRVLALEQQALRDTVLTLKSIPKHV